jgi:hypothetical protein
MFTTISRLHSRLLHLLSKLGALYHYIQVIYLTFIHSHNFSTHLLCPSTIQTRTRRQFIMKFSLHHLLFIPYITPIFTVTLGIFSDALPLPALTVTPTIGLYMLLLASKIHRLPIISRPFANFIKITAKSSNYQKFCYLMAWQSTQASTIE